MNFWELGAFLVGVLVGFSVAIGYGLIVIRQKEKRAEAALAAFQRREQMRADLRAAFDRLVARHGGTVIKLDERREAK
jgi:hypothetical protein